MARRHPDCMGNYDFEQIAYFARKRFVEGCDTVELLSKARSDTEKEEIALVCLLDVEDTQIREIGLSCRYADRCRVTDCRARLKRMIEADLGARN